MAGRRLEVGVEGGTADGLLFAPAGDGPFPLVVQYMDAGGLRPAMQAMADPLVDAGYAVVQPNLYWRSGPYAPFDVATVFSDPDERKRLSGLMNAFTPEQAMADTRAFLAALDADPRIRADRVGCVGYCMGGRMTFYAASSLADRVVAAASIHGGGLVTPAPNSPHLAAPRIRGELYFAVADQDPSCTPEQVAQLRAALDAAGVRYEVEPFPGARHGFAMPDFPVYVPEAAERQWDHVLRLFARTLGSGRA